MVEKEQTETEEKRLAELLEEEKKRSDELLANMKYLQADFENYRKRVDKEMKDVAESAISGLVFRLLSVLDELELAIANAEANGESGVLLDGIRMVYKNLSSTLEKEGLRRIESLGKPFNPDLHEAVEKVQGKGNKGDVVIEEIRKGFLFGNQVIRPCMVKVKLASKDTEDGEVVASE